MVLLDGLLVRGQKGQTQAQSVTAESLGLVASIHMHKAGAADAARGGSVLSAAELESSKQYLQTVSGEWKIAYLVSELAEGYDVSNRNFTSCVYCTALCSAACSGRRAEWKGRCSARAVGPSAG